MSYTSLSSTDLRTEYVYLEDMLDRIFPNGIKMSHYERETENSKVLEASKLVEMVLFGLPILPVYVDGTDKNWKIIDGEKRLILLYGFMHNYFALHGTRTMMDTLEGRYFRELSISLQDKLLYTKTSICVLNPGMSNYARYTIYQYLHAPSNGYKNLLDIKQILPESFTIVEAKCGGKLKFNERNYVGMTAAFHTFCYMALSKRLASINTSHVYQHIDELLISTLEDKQFLETIEPVDTQFLNLVSQKRNPAKRNLFTAALSRDKKLIKDYSEEDLLHNFDLAWDSQKRKIQPSMGDSCEVFNQKIEFIIKNMRR